MTTATPFIPILFEDNDIVVIDKPSGIVVNNAISAQGLTIQEWAKKRYISHPLPEDVHVADREKEEFYARSGVIHRLDKDTSGVLLLAKNPYSFAFCKTQFQNRVVKKEYVALCYGIVKPTRGEISAPIERLPWNRTHFGVMPEGREARTTYHVSETFTRPNGAGFSLILITPHTGRTHQIRVHLQYLKHPVVGDSLYGGKKRLRIDKAWCTRLMLHAYRLTIALPSTHEKKTFVSPLPEAITAPIRLLAQESGATLPETLILT